jgi:hypothetical protein
VSQQPWLDDDELKDLTGYVRPTHQARWLSANAIKFYVNALNKVRVPREAIAGVVSATKQKRRTEPDFTKIRRAS